MRRLHLRWSERGEAIYPKHMLDRLTSTSQPRRIHRVQGHSSADGSHGQSGGRQMSLLILVVDDEPDALKVLFRQQFRRDIRDGRFTMDFAQSADSALKLISDAAGASLILILSDINMPGMTGLELLPKAKAARPDVPVIMITAYGDDSTRRKALEGGAEALPDKARRFCCASQRDRQPSGRGRDPGPLRVNRVHLGRRPTTSGLPLETDILKAGLHLSKVPKTDLRSWR